MENNPAVTTPATSKLHPSQPNGVDPTEPQVSQSKPTSSLQHDSRNDHGWRRVVRNFSPSWFSVTMGTGVVAVLFINIPFQADWLHYLSIVFFILNTILFFLAFVISVLRYTIWPEIWSVMIRDPTNSLFLGTIPMGFATLISAWISICVPAWGLWAVYFAFALWILDSVVAIAVTVTLGILLMSASHQRSLDSITAAQLLPIAATIVASAVGSNIANVMPNPQLALGAIIASYVMWGMAVPMAFSVLVIYYQRLALHKMPPREVIVSAFLPLGPLGYGGYTVLNLGRAAVKVFPLTGSIDPIAGRIAYVMGFFVSLVMWGYGLIWFALALASIWKARPFPFNMGWWGFTFPLGVYSLSTILIGKELPSLFFRVLGTIFATCVILLWILIAVRTGKGAWTGKMFHAPCLANLKKQQEQMEEEKSIGSTSQNTQAEGNK
ncbi:unnamed protein product [Zymoseptoria tritici ST99CH_1A5]|uniref:Sulfite efflux pump SSU1 n=2 Tax=Zymoseptoria tritici TaxID=1047171 RepID=A0A1Y6LFX4_ZYMTR|nr:unnamed protein product [Zymoseptoria tritici ST99CH_1A5]